MSIIACQAVGASGSFSRTSYSAGMDGIGGGGYYKGGPGTSNISFNANKANANYGTSDVVMPPSYNAPVAIYLGA